MKLRVEKTYKEMNDSCSPQNIQQAAMSELEELGANIHDGSITVTEDDVKCVYVFEWSDEV